MWWSVVLLFASVNCHTVKYAEKRVINGVDYAYYQPQQQLQQLQLQQQQLQQEQSQGISAYSSFAQKMPDQGEPKNLRTIIVTKKVPVPYPVQVEKQVPVPVKVPIRRPYTVYVPKPYYVEVMKQVPVPVKVPVPQPYTVEKHVPFPYKVHYDKPYPVHITKPYPVYYEKRFPVHVEKPVTVPYKIHVDRPIPVRVPMERPMYFPVERPYPFALKVPVDKPIASHKPVPVPVTVEKPHLAAEQSMTSDYYASTQPTVHNTFSPSPYDELTSTMLTEGKHKVISFLPGSGNTFGSYGSSSADIGTIHVSNIKGNGGNASEWVPKAITNNQYLTYIPNTQPKFMQYTVPQKYTKLQEVSNAEQYVVKHGSVKMHYKLHYDPVKQEYSFQLAPKTQSTPQHTGYSYQALTAENSNPETPQTEYVYKTPNSSQDPKSGQTEYVYQAADTSQYPKSGQTEYVYQAADKSQYPKSGQTEYVYQAADKSQYSKSGQTEYVYQTPDSSQDPKSGKTEYVYQTADGTQYPKSPQTEYVYETPDSSQYPKSTKMEYIYKTLDGQSLSAYQFPTKSDHGLTYSYQTFENKPDVNTAQQSSNSPKLEYYPSEQQQPQQQQQQTQYKSEAPYKFQDPGKSYDTSQVAGQIPQVTYSYVSPAVDSKPEHQPLSSDHVTYTYQNVDSNSKIGFETQFKTSEYPTEHVSYMYVPRSSQQETAHETQYSVVEQNQITTEYPQMLYQQGRIATITRDQYVTLVTADDGGIPENSKSSRTSENLFTQNDTRVPGSSANEAGNEVLTASTTENRPLNRRSRYNRTNEEASSIVFEKFGVADVMSGVRTKLYPVNDSSEPQQHRAHDTSESSSSTSSYDLGIPLEHYFQENESSPDDVTEGPFNAKVYRLSSYKVPRSRRVTRTKRKKSSGSHNNQDQTSRYDGTDETTTTTTSTSLDWYRFFTSEDSQRSQIAAKETNSHTGAADRAPFYGVATSTSTTTTSDSLQPPDESITIKPTQSLRTRSRGSVRAYSKRKEGSPTEGYSTTEGNSTTEVNSTTEGNSTTEASRTRRRRRPARRRMDQARESSTEETLS